MRMLIILASLFSLGFSVTAHAQDADPDPDLWPYYEGTYGEEMAWHIHDPSNIVRVDDALMLAATGKANEAGYTCGLETWMWSQEDEEWVPHQCVLTEKPAWISEMLPANGGAYWAPALLDERTLIYSVSEMDAGLTRAIGLARAEGEFPDVRWVDSGAPLVMTVLPENNFEGVLGPAAIDPSVFVDEGGRTYLVWGGGSIYVTELDPNTLQPLTAPTIFERGHPGYAEVARGPELVEDGFRTGEPSWVEASYLYRHADAYYLFVNWGACCRGLDSTYEIRVGRSDSPTGPFLDANGVDLRNEGGTLVMDSQGSVLGNDNFIGPGHTGIYTSEEGDLCLSFHFYSADKDGLPWVASAEIAFVDGWIEVLALREVCF